MRLWPVVLLPLLPAIASAQLCLGNAASGLTHVEGAGNANFDRLANRFTLEARVRVSRLLAAAEYGVKTWDITSLDGNSYVYALTVGIDLARPKARVGVCPILLWHRLSGPHRFGPVSSTFSENAVAGGLSVGALLLRKRVWDLIPTASLTLGSANPKITNGFGDDVPVYQDWCCGRHALTVLNLGLGFGFSDEVTLIPSVSLPLGGERAAQRTYSVRAALRIGRGGL